MIELALSACFAIVFALLTLAAANLMDNQLVTRLLLHICNAVFSCRHIVMIHKMGMLFDL